MSTFEGGGFGDSASTGAAAEREMREEAEDVGAAGEQREREIEAIKLLNEVRSNRNMDPAQIRIEEYGPYLEAAMFYQETTQNDNNFKPDADILDLAKRIIKEAPQASQFAA